MSGRRERTPGQELGSGLRRYVPGSDAASGNGGDSTGDGPPPPPDGRRRRASQPADEAIGVVERRAPMATPRRLGEILVMARQSKGIELERAARDTKIRSHYLAALEAGDFRELPGTVYTKGFLRNYAQYLGLDPDVVINHYNRELGGRGVERVSIVARTLRAPRGGLTITPGLLVGLVLTVAILAFGGYIAVQFMRFAQPPEVAVTIPATVESTIDAERTTFAGMANPGATVTITGPDGPVTATADASGKWTAEVPLRKGRNEFIVGALDPETSKHSPEQRIIVMVPLPPSGPQAPVLSLTSPADGTTFTNGAIPIVGTTTGTTITVSATFTGPAAGAPATPTAESPPAPAPQDIEVQEGAFDGSYELTTGTWQLTVTATGDANRQTSVTRSVMVAYTGVNVLVEIKGGRVWLRVRVDGELAKETPSGGAVFEDGTKLTFTAEELVEIRSGVPGYTYVTVNGTSYGKLGGGIPGAWAIGPTGPPEPE
jgi:cytoskeletal protein RodZ